MFNMPKEIVLKCLECKSENLSKDEQEIVTCKNCETQIGYKDLKDKTIDLQKLGDQLLSQSKPKGNNWK